MERPDLEALCRLRPDDGLLFPYLPSPIVEEWPTIRQLQLTSAPSLLNSRQLKFCLSAVGIFGFLAFESSREALKDRSEDQARHTD